MAITNFIPTVWSETLLEGLDREYVAVKNCNRAFEGDIKGKGSSVKISAIGDINVFDYSKDSDMEAPQALSDTATTLVISQAKAFNFQIDDIDRAQSQPKLMQAALKQAAAALANVADQYVFSIYNEVPQTGTVSLSNVGENNILSAISYARQLLMTKGVNSNTDTVLEVSPEVACVLLKAKYINETDNKDIIDNGFIGKIFGFDVYVTNNIAKETDTYHCFARTKRSIAFAEQLSEVEAYRPENRFADAVKGLHLYGAKVVYPNEIVRLDLTM